MTGLSSSTVRKYTDESFQIEHASLGVKRGGKLSPYKEEIHALFEKGWRAIDIAEEVCNRGCTATKSTVTHYVAELRKQKKLSIRFKSSHGSHIKKGNFETPFSSIRKS